MAALKELDSDTFDEVVYDEARPIAVLFTRKTCSVCHQVLPVIEKLADEARSGEDPNLSSWTFAQVDAEDSFDLVQRFGLAGVPQLLVFVDGELHAQLSGKVTETEVRSSLK